MADFLVVGSVLGGVLGLLHGVWVYRLWSARRARLAGLYYGLWTFALWTLFGAYVLGFWLLSILAYGLRRALPGGARVARPT